jgi:hypothetical protein
MYRMRDGVKGLGFPDILHPDTSRPDVESSRFYGIDREVIPIQDKWLP